MKRFAQNQTDEPTEQSVALSPRVLLTGPQQITRLERQYRTLSTDIQAALDNLTKTKDAYVTALSNFEQASEYMRWFAPQARQLGTILANPNITAQQLSQAVGEIQNLTSGGQAQAQGQQQTASSQKRMVLSADVPALNTIQPNTAQPQQQVNPLQNANQQMQNQQSAQAWLGKLRQFASEMTHQFGIHQQRKVSLESQYNASKAAYAKIRQELFTLQNSISTLTGGLSAWNDRLSEFYAPSGE